LNSKKWSSHALGRHYFLHRDHRGANCIPGWAFSTWAMTMKGEKVHIWPHLAHEADKPKSGWFAVTLGRGQPERALSVVYSDGRYFVYLDRRLLARQSDDWKAAFGRIYQNRSTLTGRRLTAEEYDQLCRERRDDEQRGANLSRPINLTGVRPPF
jgi:hypothetical protein